MDIFDNVATISAYYATGGEHPWSVSTFLHQMAAEMGEVNEAYIGLHGLNPRKGVTHSQAQFLDEAADVAATALALIRFVTGSTDAMRAVVEANLDKAFARIPAAYGGTR